MYDPTYEDVTAYECGEHESEFLPADLPRLIGARGITYVAGEDSIEAGHHERVQLAVGKLSDLYGRTYAARNRVRRLLATTD